MILLKEMGDIERTLVTIQCNKFYLCSYVNNHFREAYNEIVSIVGAGYSVEAWLFVAACSQALKKGVNGSELSRDKNKYAIANSKMGQGLSYAKTIRVADILEHEGYIDLYLGYHSLTGSSHRSCFIMKDKMLSLFDQSKVKLYVRPQSKGSELEIRNKAKEVISTGQGLKGSGVIREEVANLNSMMLSHNITLRSTRASVEYHRVFFMELGLAGRWYGGSVQNIPSRYRKELLIDGEDTIELDFSAQHASILYTQEGIEMKEGFKPYWVNKTHDVSDSVWRQVCKDCLLCLINAESRSRAAGAVHQKLKDNAKSDKGKYEGFYITKPEVTKIIKEIEKNNKQIKHRFYEEILWAKLQHTDSEILACVVRAFTNTGKPMLLYHDSVLVKKSDKDYLMSAMQAGWLHVLGTIINCKIDEK